MTVFNVGWGMGPKEDETAKLVFDPERGDYVQTLPTGKVRYSPEEAMASAKRNGLQLEGMGLDLRSPGRVEVKAGMPRFVSRDMNADASMASVPREEDRPHPLSSAPTYKDLLRLISPPTASADDPSSQALGPIGLQEHVRDVTQPFRSQADVDGLAARLLKSSPPPSGASARPAPPPEVAFAAKAAPQAPYESLTSAMPPQAPPPPGEAVHLPPGPPPAAPAISPDMLALQKAQRDAAEGQLAANLTRAGSQAINAISRGHAPVDKEFLDSLSKQAQGPMERYSQTRNEQDRLKREALALAATDPNSAQSKAVQRGIAKMAPGLYSPEELAQITASNAEMALEPAKMKAKLAGELQVKQVEAGGKASEAALNRENALKVAGIRASAPNPIADVRRMQATGMLSQHMLDSLDPGKWGGAAEAQVKNRDQATHLLALTENAKTAGFNNLDSREQEELAIGFTKLLSGGQGSEAQVKSLIPPKTLQSGAQGIKEWLLNEPQGRNQLAFVERLAHSVERQKRVAEGVIDQEKAQRAAGHQTLKKADPLQWESNIRAAHLDPANFDENGVYQPPKEGAGGSPGATGGPHGPSVVQNGVKYDWNPKTGKYE